MGRSQNWLHHQASSLGKRSITWLGSTGLHICHCSPPWGKGGWALTHFPFLVGGRLFRGVDSPALWSVGSPTPRLSILLCACLLRQAGRGVRAPPAALGLQPPRQPPWQKRSMGGSAAQPPGADPALPPTSAMTLGALLNLSGPRSPICQTRRNDTLLQGVTGLKGWADRLLRGAPGSEQMLLRVGWSFSHTVSKALELLLIARLGSGEAL